MTGRPSLEGFLKAHADAWLRAAGHSRPMADAAKLEAGNWLRARTAAVKSGRRLYAGRGIVWTNAAHGNVELARIEVPSAGRGEVTVAVHASAVSPGTERANYLRLPHAQPALPFRPGYSAAGEVVAVGAGVEGLSPGHRVAVTGAPHASVATVPASDVHRLPDGVGTAAAATVMLGVISGQGVEIARVRVRESVCVFGAGLIGLLAQRIAQASGAGPVTVVAASRRREAQARAGGAAEFLTAGDERLRDFPIVIEASGSPSAAAAAVAAAAPGGRVVLLGSTRGDGPPFPMQQVMEKRLDVIGAHVSTLARESVRRGVDRRREMAEKFLGLVATGAVFVDDIVERSVDPREAELFYRELAASDDLLGAVFDWTVLDAAERVGRAALLRVPDLSGRGADSVRRLASPARDQTIEDPFAGARGRLRFGLVGCGDIAGHNANAIGVAPNTALTATYDVDQALAQEIAAQHGAEAADSYEELLARGDVDAVFISVPHHLHASLARQAAAAGKHIVVEKPPANDLANALDMVAAAEAAGVALSVCFPHRYDAHVSAARRLLAAGAVGEIAGVTAELFMDRSPSYRLGGFSSRSISDWRNSREKAGGGVLIMNLSHYLDLLVFLTGLDAESVSAFGGAQDAGAEIEDTITMSMRLANGAPGSVVGTTQARGSVFTQLRIWGPSGQIALEHDPRFYTLKSVDGLSTTRWQRFGRLPAVDIRAAFVSRFATAIATGAPPEVSGRDALVTQGIMEAAYRSIDTGRPVRPAELRDAVIA